MSEEHKNRGHHGEITIIVNAREKKVNKHTLSFDEIVALAFENVQGDTTMYTVTYRNADEEPRQGTLVSGQSVEVKNGTIFNVTATNKA